MIEDRVGGENGAGVTLKTGVMLILRRDVKNPFGSFFNVGLVVLVDSKTCVLLRCFSSLREPSYDLREYPLRATLEILPMYELVVSP